MSDVYSVSDDQFAGVLKELWIAVAQEQINMPHGLKKRLPIDPFAERSGTQVNISRYAELPDDDSAISNEYTRKDFRALVTGSVVANIVTLGDNVAPSETAELTSLDGAEMVPRLIAAQGNRSVERYMAKNITAFLRMMRADLDSTYQKTTEATSDGASDGTTIINTVHDEADDFWNGALVTLIDEEHNELESRYVTDFTASSDTLTFATAFTSQILDGVRYQITHFTAIAAGDKLTLDNMREVQTQMHGSGHFGNDFEISGGGYWLILDAFNYGDIEADSNLILLFQNKEKEVGLRDFKGDLGSSGRQLLSMSLELTQRPFRCAVTGAGTYARAGVVDIALVLGKNAASQMPLEKNDIEIIVKPKDEGGHANAMELFSTIAWKYKVAAALHDTSGAIGIACGQSRSN